MNNFSSSVIDDDEVVAVEVVVEEDMVVVEDDEKRIGNESSIIERINTTRLKKFLTKSRRYWKQKCVSKINQNEKKYRSK